MKRFYLIFALLIISTLTLSFNFKSTDVLSNLRFSEGPSITFNEITKDFGKITQGEIVQYEFPFSNTGNQELVITNVTTSCGCTAATSGDKTNFAAGESGVIKITFNSNGKQGHIEKTVMIESNDPVSPQMILTLFFDVAIPTDMSNHMMFSSNQSIFEGVCADCHVTKGIGKIGKDLYDNDCAICHGDAKDHKPHEAIDKNSTKKYTDEQLFDYISNGSVTQPTMMPGFHKKNGGPLTDEEISSLVTYIRSDLSVDSQIR
ncbi:hypothetical protein BH10BAC5_BH10BAC5_17510 [soil metagenome]